jgi:CheY-like chemotaxis protein
MIAIPGNSRQDICMRDDFFKSILVVEDDHTNSEVIRSFLLKKGYGCRIASDADQALAELGQQHFDLVISDIVMGKKMVSR